ncbi:MAG TPA: hypothetical protein VG308_01300 [Stellaceae bacterium]|jgi:hypothetical protein|nr:hypothetical protein [Stellaceae bacterium]
MRLQAAMALAIAMLLAGCGGGGLLGLGKKPGAAAGDIPDEITKPLGPHMVSRCPVPVAYDDATLKRIQDALQALPKDNILHRALNDYETERDNLRMCQ